MSPKFLKAVLCVAGVTMVAGAAHAGAILDGIKSRGEIRCGVGGTSLAFSRVDGKGEWHGLDVDYCKALNAAVFGDPTKLKFKPVSLEQRFIALRNGEFDVLARDSGLFLTRDTTLGVSVVFPNFYTPTGFTVLGDTNIKSPDQLNGATFCQSRGDGNAEILATYMKQRGFKYKIVQHERLEEGFKALEAGRCDAMLASLADIAGIKTTLSKNPDNIVFLKEVLGSIPYSPYVAKGDDEWLAIARWVLIGLIRAEELGITKDNVEQLAASSENLKIREFLGVDGKLGEKLGLPRDFMRKAIAATGNYGEIYERNLGAKSGINLPRGQNELAAKGGLMYAWPFQ
ncbi:transporter substrate-binding domain-containing protein [Microvirga sp. VF16]|uniref:transporter substrate-binding domain-containing protein n=1 Tax=Microvirga sp. VF16 TaxID=2807101 RepID=UPI00193C86CC|nr:transporter substrate-binding domain-containing protein [Microvirga sp. VF16]QRM32894.1 transporter substrate-binding domain-containing protein [Microvirga sp. VF16]